MPKTLGSDDGAFQSFKGDIISDSDGPLLSTQSIGSTAYAIGSSLSAGIYTGVQNGTFADGPQDPDSAISDADNPLPYYGITSNYATFTVTNVSGTGTTVTYTCTNTLAAGQIVTITGVTPTAYNLTGVTVATASGTQFTVTNAATGAYVSGGIVSPTQITASIVADATVASGAKLRFSIPAGTGVGQYLYFNRYVSVPGSVARTFTYQPRVAWKTTSSTAQVVATIFSQFYQTDIATTTGTSASNSPTLATIAATAGGVYETQVNPNVTGAVTADAAFVLIRFGVSVSTLTTAAWSVDAHEVRIDRNGIQTVFTDQVVPDSYGYGVIYLNNGVLWISANETGPSGSKPKMYLSGASGVISIQPSGSDVILQDTNASNGTNPRLLFQDRTGTYYAGLKSGAAGVMQVLSGNATTTYGQLWAARIYPMNGATASRYIYDDGTNTRFTGPIYGNSTVYGATGVQSGTTLTSGTNILCGGVILDDTPTGTTATTNAAIWVLISGTNYELRRNTSSARYKTSIVDADEAVLEAAKKIKPRHYESTIPEEAGTTRLGFIAEEVEAAGLTHAVGYDGEGRVDTIDPTALIAALYARVNELEERLAALESR
jgi:hypothetical protein